MHGSHTQCRRQEGLVLLAVLVFILVTTLAASTLVVVHQTQTQREKEEQLLFAGDQFRNAIASYYNSIPPGGARALPQSLEMLIHDHRFPTPIHHLRRIYPDPMTGQNDWQLVVDGGAVAGVKSSSTQRPIKRKGFSKGHEHLENRETYAEWIFSIQR